jgi:aminoglycoside 2'-N-acetyltransferase I
MASRVKLAHTAALDASALATAHALPREVFGPKLTSEDWDHCLGGIHALLWERGELIGHAALIQRQLTYDKRALRAGYIEGVAVRAGRRRQDHGASLMAAVEPMIVSAYDLGALGSSEDGVPFYAARGWTPWQGPTYALTPDGRKRTAPEDGSIYVLQPTPPLVATRPLTCDYRAGALW